MYADWKQCTINEVKTEERKKYWEKERKAFKKVQLYNMYWNVGRVMLYNEIVYFVQSSFLYLLTYVVDSFFQFASLFCLISFSLCSSMFSIHPTQCSQAEYCVISLKCSLMRNNCVFFCLILHRSVSVPLLDQLVICVMLLFDQKEYIWRDFTGM